MVLGAHSFMFLCVIYLSYNSVTIHSVFIFRAVAVAVMFTRKCFKFIHFSYRFAGHGFFMVCYWNTLVTLSSCVHGFVCTRLTSNWIEMHLAWIEVGEKPCTFSFSLTLAVSFVCSICCGNSIERTWRTRFWQKVLHSLIAIGCAGINLYCFVSSVYSLWTEILLTI